MINAKQLLKIRFNIKFYPPHTYYTDTFKTLLGHELALGWHLI